MKTSRRILFAAMACEFVFMTTLPHVGARQAAAQVFFKEPVECSGEDSCTTIPPPVGLKSKADAQAQMSAHNKTDDEMAVERKKCSYEQMALPKNTLGKAVLDDFAKGKIKNIVVLMQENRSFDHYLSKINAFKAGVTAPSTTQTNIKGGSKAAYTADVPTESNSSVFGLMHEAPLVCTTDLAHEWWAIHYGWNYGEMNKFVEATKNYHAAGTPDFGLSGESATLDIDNKPVPKFRWLVGSFQNFKNGLDKLQYLLSQRYDGYEDTVPWNAFKAAYKAVYQNAELKKYGTVSNKLSIANYFNSGMPSMQYFDDTDLPFYYELASTFPIGDRYFSSVLGPTFVNRDYLYGASSWGLTYNYTGSPYGLAFESSALEARAAYLNRDTGEDHLASSIYDQLELNGITTKTYVSHGVSYKSLARFAAYAGLKGGLHTSGIDAFFKDAKKGELPKVSFIDSDIEEISALGEDEHPSGDVQVGQHFTWEIVKAVMTSPQWKDTALFITYDENGGFYDHVAPPKACRPDEAPLGYAGNFKVQDKAWQDQVANAEFKDQFDFYGVRVPVFVVSPWAKPGGYVSHKNYDHASIVRFIQAVNGLPALSKRDANSESMIDFFDFSGEAGPLLNYPAGFVANAGLAPSEDGSTFVNNAMSGAAAYTRPTANTAKLTGKAWTGVNANYTAAPFPEPPIDQGKYLLCAMLFNHATLFTGSFKAYSEAPTFGAVPGEGKKYPMPNK